MSPPPSRAAKASVRRPVFRWPEAYSNTTKRPTTSAISVVATTLMAEVVGLFVVLLYASGHLNTGRLTDAFAALLGGGLIGAGVYFLAAFILRSEEMGTILRRLPELRLRPRPGAP